LLLLLGLMGLRALVPAGFMLAPLDGRLQLVICDSNAHGLLHQHHHHGGQDSGHAPVHPDPTCPYAQSAGPAPLPALPVMAAECSGKLLPPSFELAQLASPFGPTRQQTPRGPPVPA
jgi:hypothetical protein